MKTKLAAAVLAGIAGSLGAETAPTADDAAELPPVVVYASRIDDVREDMAAQVQVLDADAIAASGARDLPELLKQKAGMDVHALNGNPLLTSVGARGFGENGFARIKVVLDGEELNNVDMAAPNLARIPIWNVGRVEIVHGPSPVLYGDGAVAGVVNVVTDTHDYERKTKITGRAGSQYTFGGSFLTKGGFEDEGVQYNAAYDYLQSDGYRRRSAYDLHTANAGVRKNFENGSTIGFKANYQNAFYELPGSLSYYQWKHARKSANNHDDWARIWSYGLGLDAKLKLADDQRLYLDGGFAHRLTHAVYGGLWPMDNEYESFKYAFSPRYVNENDIGGFGNKFIAGTDFRFDYYENDPKAGNSSHFNRARVAGFVYDEFFVLEELSLIAGSRLEGIDNRWCGVGPWTGWGGMRKPKTRDWMGDFELGAVFRPTDGLKLYAKGARYHRSAFCDELSYAFNGDPIKPETGTSLDVGAEWKFLDEFTFEANGYGSVAEDEIFLDPGPTYGIWYNRNSPAKTRRIGLDTGLAWRRDKFAEASVRYGVVHADFGGGDYHGKDVPYVPNHRIRAEAGYWIFDDLEIKGGYAFVGSQHLSSDYANEADKLPGYSLFDLGVYYEPSWAKGWKASFVVDNLFDRNYCDYAGYSGYGTSWYYPAMGRSFLFTLSYEF